MDPGARIVEMGRKKQSWGAGDVFVVEMGDGRCAVGQIVGREAGVLNSVSVAFFDQRCERPEDAPHLPLTLDRVISVVFSTRDLLDSWTWRVVGNRPVVVPQHLLPYEATRASGWVGAKVIGSGNLRKFLDAYFGLRAWDDWHDPEYLDRFLLSPDKKPKTVILKAAKA